MSHIPHSNACLYRYIHMHEEYYLPRFVKEREK